MFCSITPTNIGQLHVLRIPKLFLKVKFEQDLTEKFKVKDNRSISKKMSEIRLCLLPRFSQPNLGQIYLSGTVLESSERADSKTVPGFDN